MTARPRVAMPYAHAVRWLLDNDDCEWLDEGIDEAPGSVTAAFVADCYRRTDQELRADLLRIDGQRKADRRWRQGGVL